MITPTGEAVRVAGIVLAAGAGTRMGRPKALVRDRAGTPWVRLAATAMTTGGCAPVMVVTGAGHAEVERLLPTAVRALYAADWAQGMSVSLRAGLGALADLADPPQAAIVGLVDMPDVDAAVVTRLRAAATGPHVLARAAYQGRPGHPVLLGREHWTPIARTARADMGAREYLRARTVVLVESGDLASGLDLDTQADLDRRTGG